MTWLHTWAGLVLGGVLFAILWTGTLSVFDQEIDRWMIPATRLEPAAEPVSLDALADFYQAAVADGAPSWRVVLPYGRDPVLRLSWRRASGNIEIALRPDTGERLPHPETLAATGFLFPFHYSLHIGVGRLGYWIVAAATMGMLALCVSGVAIHRRLFVDFFVFRPGVAPARSIRDLHTVSGILGLPFNVVIAISGLVLCCPSAGLDP